MKNKSQPATKFGICLRIIKLSCWGTENFALCIVGILVSSKGSVLLFTFKTERIHSVRKWSLGAIKRFGIESWYFSLSRRSEGHETERIRTIKFGAECRRGKQPDRRTSLAKWKRRYQGWAPDEGWFILTNLDCLETAVLAYIKRFDIEEMFRDFKSGGYKLEETR